MLAKVARQAVVERERTHQVACTSPLSGFLGCPHAQQFLNTRALSQNVGVFAKLEGQAVKDRERTNQVARASSPAGVLCVPHTQEFVDTGALFKNVGVVAKLDREAVVDRERADEVPGVSQLANSPSCLLTQQLKDVFAAFPDSGVLPQRTGEAVVHRERRPQVPGLSQAAGLLLRLLTQQRPARQHDTARQRPGRGDKTRARPAAVKKPHQWLGDPHTREIACAVDEATSSKDGCAGQARARRFISIGRDSNRAADVEANEVGSIVRRPCPRISRISANTWRRSRGTDRGVREPFFSG
jgi:hypothetical protein